MTTLRDELKKKYSSPQAVLKALGIDQALLKEHTMAKPTKFASTALQLTAAVVGPLLAKDQKVDLMPIFKDLTLKNFDKKKIKMALDGALKGKMAKDAEPSMSHVASMLDHIEHMSKPEVADESASKEQHNAMEAAAHGTSNLGIPKKVGEEFSQADKGKTFDAEGFRNFLKEKGVGDEDIEAACDMVPENSKFAEMKGGEDEDVGLDETEEEKAAREKKEGEDAKRAADEKEEKDRKEAEDRKHARDAEMKNMVTKDEMSAAVKSAIAAATKQTRETEQGIRTAIAKVKPWVGEFAADMAFDSATDVFRRAAGMLKVKNADKLHPDALEQIIENMPRPGTDRRQAQDENNGMAADAATVDDYDKMFPGASHIDVGFSTERD